MIKSRTTFSRGSLIVWIISYLFFILTLVNNFSASHDSIHYLNDIVSGKNLFHQHHLLYHFLANKWMIFWKGIFNCGTSVAEKGRIFCQPHYLIESFTAVWGASALTLIYLFLRRRFYQPRNGAFLGVAVVAYSYGFWFYSVNIEVYLPPLFFILLCLYTLTKKEFSRNDIVKVAVFHSLAILFHQINILFVIVVLYVLVKNKFYRSIINYALAGILIVGGAYFITGWFIEGHNSFSSWMAWMQGYTVGHDYWQPLSLKTPLHVIAGFSRAFVGGHFIFQVPAVDSYLQNSFAGHGLKDEIFLSTNLDAAMALGLLVLSIILAVYVIVLLIKFIVGYRSIKPIHYVTNPIIITILVYSLFFCFWMPEILEFWILQMVLIWILITGIMRNNRSIFILAALLFIINYFGSIRWLQESGNDWYHNETQKIIPSISEGDLIIVENEWILKDYLRYYTTAVIIATDEPGYNKEATDKLIAEKKASNRKVFIYDKGIREVGE